MATGEGNSNYGGGNPASQVSTDLKVGDAVMPGLGTSLSAAADAVGGIAQGFASIFGGGGGSSQKSGYTISPEEEIQLINYFGKAQSEITEQKQQVGNMLQVFQDKLSTYEGMLKGTIPSSDALKSLTDQNAKLALSLGADAQDLVNHGFLTSDEGEALSRQKQLALTSPEDYGKLDPEFQQNLSDNRARLDQDLRRQGASASTRAQALAQFDRDAKAQTFSRGQQLVAGQSSAISSYLGNLIGARSANFGQAVNSFNVGQSEIGSAREGIGGLTQLSELGYQSGISNVQTQQALTQSGFQDFQTLGQFKISKQTNNLIKGGAIGPGTTYQQTGLPSNQTGSFARSTNKAENNAFKAQRASNESKPDISAILERLKQRYGSLGSNGIGSAIGANITRA